ncbi:MAG: hypothetical protein JXA52_04250, partial [Planctomycetes bacterium]|nr:hypothetical protein [Planctomycetota bacterium]
MKENLGKFLKNILPPASVERLKGVRDIAHLGRTVSDLQGKFLREQYPGLVACEDERTYLALNEYKAFSQYGEDGLLLYIFSQIGIANFSFVEIGIGTGRECNTAALSIYFGWHGLLIDGDADNVKLARAHYGACLGRETERVKVAPGFVTTENVNEIITQHGMAGEIDLLSIDIDGNDYWVWQAIEAVEPRTVVIEYNASFGPEKAITVPYDPAFNRHDK